MRRWTLLVALTIACTVAAAQTHTPTAPAAVAEATGSVTGHVFCGDTNDPARFASVSLEAVPAPTSPTAKPGAPADSESPHAAQVSFGGGSTISVQTTLDGSFVLSKVKPGDYFVIVAQSGYIKARALFTRKEIDDPSPEMRALVERVLPRVHVEANQSQRVEVSLERGGAVSGTILYDDGSPAGGLGLRLLHKDASGKWDMLNRNFEQGTRTDDRGNFRMASLLADEYMIEADLSLADTKTSSFGGGPQGQTMQIAMMSFRFSLPFYGAGMPRQKDAKGFKLTAGQELTGQNMTIPISKLRQLSGRVAAGPDGHFVNAADLSVVTRDDGKELASTDISREDGQFHFEFVPDGDYILKVSDARDVAWDPPVPPKGGFTSPFPAQDKERVLQSYGSTEVPVLLSGDVISMVATVPPDTKPDSAKSTTASQ
jgi:hypothetical protein